MFQRGEISFSSRKAYADVAEIKQRAFGRIVIPLASAQHTGVLKDGDPEDFGLALAALVHGLVGEFIDEGLAIRVSKEQPWSKARKDMSRTVIGLLLSGLQRTKP